MFFFNKFRSHLKLYEMNTYMVSCSDNNRTNRHEQWNNFKDLDF